MVSKMLTFEAKNKRRQQDVTDFIRHTKIAWKQIPKQLTTIQSDEFSFEQ